MKILFVLLSVAFGTQFCHGTVTSSGSSSSPLNLRILNSSKSVPKLTDLASNEKRALYSYEQIVIVKDTGSDGKTRRCQVFGIHSVKNAILDVLNQYQSVSHLNVEKVNMKKMMSLMNDCDSVDNLGAKVKEVITEKTAKEPNSPNSFIHGIFPGTKWCGKGNVANGYHDLGKLRGVDRCCRTHDFCPIKVPSQGTRYNLTNKGTYTKSHCLCDEAFYNCLKKDKGMTAKFIGKLYFDAVELKCIKGLPENPNEKMQFVHDTRNW